MDEIQLVLDDMNEAIRMLEEMQSTGELLDESELAMAYSRRGMFYFQIQEFEKSISDSTKSIDIMERLFKEGKSPNEDELAKSYSSRGMIFHTIGENDQAIPDITKSIDILERLQENGQIIEKDLLNNLYIIRGSVFNIMADNMDVAISDFQKSIKIAEMHKKAGEPFDEDGLASAYLGLGQSCDLKEEFDEANKYYDKCIDIWERLISEGKPLSDEESFALAYMSRGVNYYVMYENDKAISDHNKSISIRERLMNQGVLQDMYNVAKSYKNRAIAYEIANNTKAATKDFISALQVLKEEFSERPDLQEYYYQTLTLLINLLNRENNSTLYNNVLQEILFSMQSVPKTKKAEKLQNDILKTIGS